MNTNHPKIVLAVLAMLVAVGGCAEPGDDAAGTGPAAAGTPAAVPTESAPARTASATGLVESIDRDNGTIVITHGPVEALEWPAMTMTFQAQDVDLSGIGPGDPVAFEFTSTGMDGTITDIRRE